MKLKLTDESLNNLLIYKDSIGLVKKYRPPEIDLIENKYGKINNLDSYNKTL